MGLRDYTIYDMICRNAALFPDRECLVFNDTRMTHRQYKEKCDQLAAGLHQTGFAAGDRLAVMAHNCDEFVILYGAAAKTGTIVVPVNWRFTREEAAYVFKDAAPAAVFAGADYQQMLRELQLDLQVQHLYTIGGGAAAEGFTPFDALYATPADTADTAVDGNRP